MSEMKLEVEKDDMKTKTSKGQHTTGPWVIDLVERGNALGKERVNMIASEDRRGLRVAEVKGDANDPRHAADADLIAAAPDLLSACKAALERFAGWNAYSDVAAVVSAAIAKAEGRE